MIDRIKSKCSNIKYYEEKKRFVIFVIFLLCLVVVAFKLFRIAYASYETSARLNANIDRAIYLVENDGLSFNIDSEKIVPSDEAYTYKFSIANFNASASSEIDLLYFLKVTTTTNLPLTFELYRNENYGDEGTTNLFLPPKVVQDVDGAWYNIYEIDGTYEMKHTEKTTDIYTLVVNFPKVWATNSVYADSIENIKVEIKSRQIAG